MLQSYNWNGDARSTQVLLLITKEHQRIIWSNSFGQNQFSANAAFKLYILCCYIHNI